jgi:hypothetical protein
MSIIDRLRGRKKPAPSEKPRPKVQQAGTSDKPIAKSREGRTGTVQVTGKTAFEQVLSMQKFAEEQSALLDNLHIITKPMAKDLFRKLGLEKPNEYRSGIEVFSKFRAYSLSAGVSPVRTYFLTIDPSSDCTDALYVYLDDRVMPIGVVVCKVEEETFWGRYTVGSSFKDKLGL